MLKFKSSLRFLVAVGAMALSAAQANAGFTSYVIRSTPTITPVGSNVEFVISASGQKAGYGSNDINGIRVDEIASLKITRFDDPTRFTAGSGPAVAPYFNIWVTDGLGNYAAIANEPSNPDFQPLFEGSPTGPKTYDLSFADLANKVVKVYETAGTGTNFTWVHAALGLTGQSLTFAQVANLTIAPPPTTYFTSGLDGVGSGAPREIGSFTTFGFNWIFGDTLSNYTSGAPGYIVGNAEVAATPEPTSAVLLGLGAAGFAAIRRRRKASKV
ncbi:MAG TPA: PEP-CTERM sorting domain-containing protein [Caulifigura sp.]|nr:PEP-CTERM sorting domain-containing protein [Caulifigura sp.]